MLVTDNPAARQRPSSPHSTRQGFTVVEAMVAIAVVSIVSAIAAPNFSAFIGTMRAKSAAFDLINDLAMTRSEALKRNQSAAIEPLVADDWSKGWRIVSGTQLLRERGELGSSLTIRGVPASIQFRPNGRLSEAVAVNSNVAWSISSTIRGVGARCVMITPTGSARARAGACE